MARVRLLNRVDRQRPDRVDAEGVDVGRGWLSDCRHDFDPRTREQSLRFHAVPGSSSADTEKRVAAEAAAELVEAGSTVAFLLPALASRNLSIHCVATSPATEREAVKLGIEVGPLGVDRLDIA